MCIVKRMDTYWSYFSISDNLMCSLPQYRVETLVSHSLSLVTQNNNNNQFNAIKTCFNRWLVVVVLLTRAKTAQIGSTLEGISIGYVLLKPEAGGGNTVGNN